MPRLMIAVLLLLLLAPSKSFACTCSAADQLNETNMTNADLVFEGLVLKVFEPLAGKDYHKAWVSIQRSYKGDAIDVISVAFVKNRGPCGRAVAAGQRMVFAVDQRRNGIYLQNSCPGDRRGDI